MEMVYDPVRNVITLFGGTGRPAYMADTWELVDLQEDPREYKNVYNDPAYAEPSPLDLKPHFRKTPFEGTFPTSVSAITRSTFSCVKAWATSPSVDSVAIPRLLCSGSTP